LSVREKALLWILTHRCCSFIEHTRGPYTVDPYTSPTPLYYAPST
jgi:hypothetical protein